MQAVQDEEKKAQILELIRQQKGQSGPVPVEAATETPVPGTQMSQVTDQARKEPILNKIRTQKAVTERPTPTEVTEQELQEPGFFDTVLGGAEAGLSIVSSALAEPLAGVSGLVSLTTSGSVDNAVSTIEKARKALTYTPMTQEGQSQMESFGEAMRPVVEKLTAVNESLGDFAYRTTGSPAAAAALYSLPTAAVEALGAGKLLGLKAAKNAQVAAKQRAILSDEVMKYSGEVADVKLLPNGKVVPDQKAIKLLDNGIERKDAALVAKSTPESRKIMADMINTFEKSSDNYVYSVRNKMTNHIGGSLNKRMGALKQRRKSLGSDLDRIVETDLAQTQLNLNAPWGTFFDNISKDFGLPLKRNASGALEADFARSNLDVQAMAPVRNIVSDMLKIANKTTQGVSAKEAHKLKKLLDEIVDAQKAQQAGMSNGTHRRLMGLRSDINEAIQAVSPAYKDVNGQLSKAIQTMQPFEKYMGPGQSWDTAKVSEVVGNAVRNLDGDSATAAKLKHDIANMEDSLKELGISFNDDPVALVGFKNFVTDYFSVNPEQIAMSTAKKKVSPLIADTGASLIVGNTFGVVHDLKNLMDLGVKKSDAKRFLEQRAKAKKAIKDALKD